MEVAVDPDVDEGKVLELVERIRQLGRDGLRTPKGKRLRKLYKALLTGVTAERVSELETEVAYLESVI